MNTSHLKLTGIAAILAVVALGSVYLFARPPAPGPSVGATSPSLAAVTSAVVAAITAPLGTTSTQPKITWSTTSVQVILSPGESASKDLTFTSSLKLSTIVLEPVTTVAPFVSIQPSTFASVPANQAQSVHIALSIPAGTTLGTYDGTIHLRSGSTTYPQTLKITVDVYITDEERLQTDLKKLLGPVGVTVEQLFAPPARSEEIEIKWQTDEPTSFIVLGRQEYDAPAPQLRSAELGRDQLLVAAIDSSAKLQAWTVIPDPRISRTETSGPDGTLGGQIMHIQNPTFEIAIPDKPEVTEVRFYLPQWTGHEFVLSLLGAVALQ